MITIREYTEADTEQIREIIKPAIISEIPEAFSRIENARTNAYII